MPEVQTAETNPEFGSMVMIFWKLAGMPKAAVVLAVARAVLVVATLIQTGAVVFCSQSWLPAPTGNATFCAVGVTESVTLPPGVNGLYPDIRPSR